MTASAQPRALALFDLDHTLIDGDSNTLWLDFLVERRRLPASARRLQAEYMAGYAAERLDIVDYLGFHLGLLTSRPLADWAPLRAEFVASRIVPRISAEARDAVAAHRKKNHRLAIVTATHDFLSAAIGDMFDLPVIAPKGEIRDGHLTGKVDGPVCFRETKLDCLAAWLAGQGVSDSAVGERHFYTDSANDLPLLEAVDHPVAVNADARLAAVAQRRGWVRLNWRCARKP
jgi:HAD superfamily hydrolase (TIGR01490 family)